MEELKGFLDFLPNWLATLIAAAASFGLIISRFSAIRDVFAKILPGRRSDLSKAIDLVLDQGFETFSRIARLEMGETRIRRESILDEAALGIYLRLKRFFDDKIEGSAALECVRFCANHIEIEKSLFDSVARMLLNLGVARADRLFEADSVSEMSDQAFRIWTSEKIGILSDYLSRQFVESYPEKGLVVSRAEIESLLLANKSEIRDSIFSAFFRVREAEISIQKEIASEKTRFSEFKRKLFSEIK
jgi:hypothetical protein